MTLCVKNKIDDLSMSSILFLASAGLCIFISLFLRQINFRNIQTDFLDCININR